MKFAWQVISEFGDVQSGVVDSFEQAVNALKAWFGDGTQPDRTYTIIPLTKLEKE